MEPGKLSVHQRGDLLGTEVSDAAFVCMMYGVRSLESSVLDVQPNFFVSFPERGAVQHEVVHHLDAEQVVVFRVVEDILFLQLPGRVPL